MEGDATPKKTLQGYPLDRQSCPGASKEGFKGKGEQDKYSLPIFSYVSSRGPTVSFRALAGGIRLFMSLYPYHRFLVARVEVEKDM